MKRTTAVIGQVKCLRNMIGISATGMLVVAAVLSAHAGTITKTFEFGPGTLQDHSNMRTFAIPANSVGNVIVTSDSPNNNIPLVIEVHRPDANSIGSTGPDGPTVTLVTTFLNSSELLPPQPANGGSSYSSSVSCPSTWRVRVRTANNQAPPLRISGTIKYIFTAPAPSNVTIGSNQNIDKGLSATRTVSGIVGKGDGTIRIKAKWHTDPLDFFNWDKYFPLTVTLLRPDGTTATSQTGFSQHAPAASTPKLNFTYNMNAQDINMTGSWKVKIDNNTGVNVVDYNIEKGFDLNPAMPSFTSTFTPACN